MFDRPGGPRPVRLNAAGTLLLDPARSVIATLRIATADVDAIARGDRSRLRIGVMQSVGTKILPALLTGFVSQRPGVEIELHEAQDPGDLLTMVEEQDLDIAFSGELEPAGPFITRHVLDDPFVLLVPNTPEWRERRSISIDDDRPRRPDDDHRGGGTADPPSTVGGVVALRATSVAPPRCLRRRGGRGVRPDCRRVGGRARRLMTDG